MTPTANVAEALSELDTLPVSERKLTCKDVYEHLQDGSPVGTMEVAESFEVSHMTARKRLQELTDAGLINRRKIHETTVVWWCPGAGDEDTT